MKSFFRENPTIAFGLGLPLLLVVAFLLVSGIPALLVEPPQYDVLYATESGNRQNSVQIAVVDQKVRIIHERNAYGDQTPRLWRYSPLTGAVREIPIILPTSPSEAGNDPAVPADVSKRTEIDVPELAGLTIDSSSIAPDGYEFDATRDHHSGNVFGGLFYSSRYHSEAILTKNGRNVRLPNADVQYYYRNTQFIGWVVSQ
jgi:hypothetical protein